jgi:hypothetical protein
MGLAVHAKSFYIGPVGGAILGKSIIKSTYTYRDGMESYGNEKVLNGIYTSILIKGIYGIKSGINITKKIGVFMNAMYIPKGLLVDPGLEDMSTAKGAKYLAPEGKIPTDYERFLDSRDNEAYAGDYVRSDFSGIQFSIGLRSTFTATQDE